MKTSEVRKSFFKFFENKGHKIVNSASVVPQGDKSLLFTNAGMNQFKDIFLGLKEPQYKRVVNTQKCIRVSGKHNDLEEVGVDTYHHTFFEMLGNWSFNDYYKKEVIQYAWELLTQEWGLKKEKLFVSYFYKDTETKKLWLELTDVEDSHVLAFDEKDNFWEMGLTGPCGPCSEIHYYKGTRDDFMDFYQDAETGVNGENSDFIEIWNLVFMEYSRNNKGEIHPLEKKHVDTGMGLERIVSILQGKTSNYDIDLFESILEEIELLSGKKYEGEYQVPMRVISDHIRTLVISISDGVLPSNESRGYVLRRILRRAYRYGRDLSFKGPFLYKLVDVVVNQYSEIFPEVEIRKKQIKETLLTEEAIFDKTLDKGVLLLDKIIQNTLKKNNKTVSGENAFILYDRFGFPFDLTLLMLKEKGLFVDEREFKKEMEKQKKRSKGDKKELISFEIINDLKNHILTKYIGNDVNVGEGKLLKIYDLEEKEEKLLLFDKSIFYGESGGQVGDSGFIESKDVFFRVQDVYKKEGYYLHMGILEKGELKENTSYKMSYGWERRKKIRANHSAVHLLHKVLYDELGDHVRQAGSYVDDKKARLDFNHSQAIDKKTLQKIEYKLNQLVFDDRAVEVQEMDYKKAISDKKAVAFFEEKYSDVVQVVDIGGYSIELCGGSHVKRTSEIGQIKIINETSSSFGVRRIEMITGLEVYNYYLEQNDVLEEIKQELKVSSSKDILKKVSGLQEINNKLLSQKKTLEKNQIIEQLAKINNEVIDDFNFYYHHLHTGDINTLREKIDEIKNKQEAIVLFFVSMDDKILVLVGVSQKLSQRYKANEILKEIMSISGGKGGGKPQFAQGSMDKSSEIDKIIELIKKKLG